MQIQNFLVKKKQKTFQDQGNDALGSCEFILIRYVQLADQVHENSV